MKRPARHLYQVGPTRLSALHQRATTPCCIIRSSSNSLLTACRPSIGSACGKECKLLKFFVKTGMYHSKQLSITHSVFGLQPSKVEALFVCTASLHLTASLFQITSGLSLGEISINMWSRLSPKL